MTDVVAALRDRGMSAREAVAKQALHDRCIAAMRAWGRDAAECIVSFVPGRIELFGKHTDYAGGESLLCAVERGFVVVAAPRDDATVRAHDALRHETRELRLGTDAGAMSGDWADYIATVVRRVARNFPDVRHGADIVFASDLPAAAGLSSSSALMIGMLRAIAGMNDLAHPAFASCDGLAGYAAAIENGADFGALTGDAGVGTFGGSEDHVAILCCRAGFVSRYAFCPVRAFGDIQFPREHTLIVAHSGISAEKTGAARASYNEAVLAVGEILRVWNDVTGRSDRSLAAAQQSEHAVEESIRGVLEHATPHGFTRQRLFDRLAHFTAESREILPAAAAALARGDVAAIGTLAERSQHAAEAFLGNQIPETVALARLAREHGADAASAFGAGFGGSVWAMVSAADADAFTGAWRDAYRDLFPAAAGRAEFFASRPGPAAMSL